VPSLTKDGTGRIIVKLSKDVDASSVHTAFALAGLTAESERMDVDASSNSVRVITSCYKPPKIASAVARISTAAKSISVPIKINLGDLDEDDLIDEDDLLNDAGGMDGLGLNAPKAMQARMKDDCDGRKPCDDCTCGRAEEYYGNDNGDSSTGVAEKKVIKDLKSNCGNCSRGDAFRCAGCPFLGKPAFKEGEEHLVLDLTDDL